MNRLMIVARLREGAHEDAEALIAGGPPFDSEELGFHRHGAYLRRPRSSSSSRLRRSNGSSTTSSMTRLWRQPLGRGRSSSKERPVLLTSASTGHASRASSGSGSASRRRPPRAVHATGHNVRAPRA